MVQILVDNKEEYDTILATLYDQTYCAFELTEKCKGGCKECIAKHIYMKDKAYGKD